MATISSFRELRVHQGAFRAAMRIFETSEKWPANERYELTDQVRRSSRSVCACIAEAWRKRRYPAAFVAKLNDAESEAAETRVWLDFALACRYMEDREHRTLDSEYQSILGQLVRMIDQADQWAVGPPEGGKKSRKRGRAPGARQEQEARRASVPQSPHPKTGTKPEARRDPSATRPVPQSRQDSPPPRP